MKDKDKFLGLAGQGIIAGQEGLMGHDKIIAKELDDDMLSGISGGTSKVTSLTYKGQNRKATSATYKGENRKAGNLLYTEESSLDGKMMSGDAIDKGTCC